MTARSGELAGLAALLADRTRASFCLALLDGRAWTATELATYAKVAPSTTSEHLDRLIGGGLLVERRQGRHRYVQLAGASAAELVETLASYVGPVREQTGTLKAVTASAALARGRTCYDHLAGRLGVAIADAMTTASLLDQRSGFSLTDNGLAWLTGTLGADPAALRTTRRPIARACLDWTERRSHLAGVAGAQICRIFHEKQWIRRIGSGRAVRLTSAGEDALRDHFAVDAQALALT